MIKSPAQPAAGSKDERVVRAAVVRLLLGVLAILLSAEFVVRFGFEHHSKMQARILGEWRAAISPSCPSGRRMVLVGNSLLDAGVDVPELQRLCHGEYCISRIAVGDTRYYDWFFGLRRLFTEGARPDVVALMIGENQVVDSRMRWDYTAHYLMNLGDIPMAGNLAGVDRNRLASMLLANRSAFWGTRVEVRNWLLDAVSMGTAGGLRALAVRPVTPAPRRKFENTLRLRLEALQRLVSEHRAELWVIAPPQIGRTGEVESLVRVGTGLGIRVLVPVEPGQLSRRHFYDGLHANALGAEVFTRALWRSVSERHR